MDFFSGPNKGFSFPRVDDSIQRQVLIIAPEPLLIPLPQEDVGEVMQGLLVQLLHRSSKTQP